MLNVSSIHTNRSIRATVALMLAVSVTSCATRSVTLGSPELSTMNVRSYRTRSTVTLRDGSQLLVDRLQVGAEQTRGDLIKQRPAPIGSSSAGGWQKVGEAARELAITSNQIERVVFTTGRGKGSLIGAVTGLLVGAGAGAGIGLAVAPNETCPTPSWSYYPQCPEGPPVSVGYFILGLAIGATVFSIAGAMIGLHGLKRTYVIEPAPSVPAFVPMPAPEATQ